jgi:hypothetical protein
MRRLETVQIISLRVRAAGLLAVIRAAELADLAVSGLDGIGKAGAG